MNPMDIINIPAGYLIKFCSSLVNNQYVWALLLFAIIIEILLLPFAIKQQKNSIKQSKLRPKEMAIRKKYQGRDDQATKQKLNQEIQELYQTEGYSPLSGCLPLLIQFPILIALYNIVMNPLYYICNLSHDAIKQIAGIVSSVTGASYDADRNINLLGDMKKLSFDDLKNVEGMTEELFENLPNLQLFGGAIDLAQTPSFTTLNWLIVIPVLTFFAYFFSMKITRKFSYQTAAQDQATGCSNKMMDIMMPAFSVYIAFVVPAAIGVYWIFKSILGVIKQIAIHFAMPIPPMTEEEIKAAEKEMSTKTVTKPGERVASSGRVVRSLHHIDDEDFPDTAEAGRARREALEAQEAADREARANKKGILGGAVMKDDGDKKSKASKNEDEKDKNENNDGNNDGTVNH